MSSKVLSMDVRYELVMRKLGGQIEVEKSSKKWAAPSSECILPSTVSTTQLGKPPGQLRTVEINIEHKARAWTWQEDSFRSGMVELGFGTGKGSLPWG